MSKSWVNRHQQAVIEYLWAENQSLREQLGKGRILWTDAQRPRLAENAKVIGRSVLAALGPVVTPDTLLRWKDAGVNIVRLPVRSPNLNFYVERRIDGLRAECLSRITPLGEKHLKKALASYLEHYHQERNLQRVGNRVIEARAANTNGRQGRIRRRQRVGGVLNFYYRDAA